MAEEKDSKATKKQAALKLVKQYHATKTTKELVSILMDQIPGKMTPLGARTYVYNCRKELNLEAPPRQKAAKKATTTSKKKDKDSDSSKTSTKTPKKRSSRAAKKAPASSAADDRKSEVAGAINSDE